MGLEIFKENSIEEKIKSLKNHNNFIFFFKKKKVFVRICDHDKNGAIS